MPLPAVSIARQQLAAVRNAGFQSFTLDGMPIEVQLEIYKKLFTGASINVGTSGIKKQPNLEHRNIFLVSKLVGGLAKLALYCEALQSFSDATTSDGEVIEQNAQAKPVLFQLVPAMQVFNFEPKNNVALDIGTLLTYGGLQLVELGMFARFRVFNAPHPVLEHDESGHVMWTIDRAEGSNGGGVVYNHVANRAEVSNGEDVVYTHVANRNNDEHIVAALMRGFSTGVVDDLAHKPVNNSTLRAIVNNRERDFKVLLRCHVDLFPFGSRDTHLMNVLPEGYNGLTVVLNIDRGVLCQVDANPELVEEVEEPEPLE